MCKMNVQAYHLHTLKLLHDSKLDRAPVCRADFSEIHSYEARLAFVNNIAHGEAGINLADAAFQIAAEDYALVSHSSVKLPVHQYAKRMQRMAEDIARNRLSHMPSVGSDRDPDAVLQVCLLHIKLTLRLHWVSTLFCMPHGMSCRVYRYQQNHCTAEPCFVCQITCVMYIASAALSNQECLFADKLKAVLLMAAGTHRLACMTANRLHISSSCNKIKTPHSRTDPQAFEHYISSLEALPSVYLVGSPGLHLQGPKVPVAIKQPVRCA